MKDTIRQGILAGLLGSICDFVIHWTAYFTLGTTTTSHYISQLVFPFKEPSITRLLVGLVIHFFAGASMGVLLALIFKYFGSDHPYFKGIGLGAIMWIVHVAVIPNIVGPRPFIFRTELETMVDLTSHLVYGTIATYYWVKTSARKIPV